MSNQVELADGTVINGRCVIDARGPSAYQAPASGFQKFVGLEVTTDQCWPDPLPTVMDADVPQHDGYRFMYALPFSPKRVLVEDTYFSDTSHLDRPQLRGRVEEYLRSHGIKSWQVIREESGVLPMPWAAHRVMTDPTGTLVVGYAGGWFHPATGYSFPLAVRLALAISAVPPEQAGNAAAALARKLAPRQRFCRFLNRLLFTLVTPAQRWQVFRRLYRSLPDEVMNRFYACEFGRVDAGRLLLGWPPPLSPSRLIYRPEVRPCPQLSL
jgi:lycopene beta-cyclase